MGRKLVPVKSKSDEIRDELRRRWPCQEVPWGGLTEMAKEYGVTRELIRQIAKRLNYEQRRPPKTLFFCICGKEMGSPTICADCRQFEIPCTYCETPVKRSIAAHARKLRLGEKHAVTKDGKFRNYAQYTGRVFCNKVCQGKWLAREYGFTKDNRLERMAKGGWNPATPRERRQTHCKRGHEMNEQNVYVWNSSDGRAIRYCKACHRMGKREKARLDRELKASGTTQKLRR